jgi:hypothetical protein
VHVVTSSTELRRIIKETDASGRAAALSALLDGWESGRAAADGVKESNQLARQVGDFMSPRARPSSDRRPRTRGCLTMTVSKIPTGTRERRLVKFDRVEIRAGDNGLRTLAGHAAVFNSNSEPMYGFTERIKPGCFSRAIKEDDVRALFNHDSNLVLGRNTAKTLRLSEDKGPRLRSAICRIPRRPATSRR